MIDILAIRDRLNDLPFKEGKRQVLIGRISEKFDVSEPELAEEDDGGIDAAETEAVTEYLQVLEAELQRHGLTMGRVEDDQDALYAVQELKTQSEVDLSWMREALNWVSKITTVALVMAVPGIVGRWLDYQLDTPFLSPLGLAFGALLGLWHLIQMTKGGVGDKRD